MYTHKISILACAQDDMFRRKEEVHSLQTDLIGIKENVLPVSKQIMPFFKDLRSQ